MGEFYLEKRLKETNPNLHKRLTDGISVLDSTLKKYSARYPEYTDHSMFHSLDIIEFCNEIIGQAQIQKLIPEECYVLLMGAYLHDIGMGINQKDYILFSEKLEQMLSDFPRQRDNEPEIIRMYHQEYSGLFVRKYADLFDIPEESLVKAIIQISRGHRKTDLFDEDEYGDIKISCGIIRTAYLSAVLRLADEMDVSSTRNPELLFDSVSLNVESQKKIFGIHESIQKVEIKDDMIILYSRPKSQDFIPLVWNLSQKIQDNLDYCRSVAEKRSDLRIFQKKVVIKPEKAADSGNGGGFSWGQTL